MSKVATVILNRNLPEQTDELVDSILSNNGNQDIFVLEAGSDKNNLSRNCKWYVSDEEVMKNGLRYNRGMNYALLRLYEETKFEEYDYFLLLTNDTVFQGSNYISKLTNIMEEHPYVGILSPCSESWGERRLLNKSSTKYFWFIHNNAYLLRKEFINTIANFNSKNYKNFLFDGDNFRGYLSESELIMKAYANDYAAAITSEVWANENESYLLNKSELIKTNPYDKNLKLYVEEGLDWIKRKYGFSSKWQMHKSVKLFYDDFFINHPFLRQFRI